MKCFFCGEENKIVLKNHHLDILNQLIGNYIKITKASEVDMKKPERVKWQRATQKFLSALTELEESTGSVPREKLFSVLGPG